jgi:CubicO group peptidase (beta-lactamase class C family)
MRLQPGNPEEAGMSAERVQHVVGLAEGWVAQGITPALVVLVARKGVIVIHEAFGRLTPGEDSPPLKLDTIYPIASISKPITATAAMILVEDGLLGLNRPVSWYIPEFVGEGKDAVMVHHLLTHISGLRDGDLNEHAQKKKGTVEIPPPDETQHPQINEVLFLRYDTPLWKPPGTEMSYCSHGYVLIGEIIRRVSGRSLDDFARERIFKPLGMKDTFYIVPELVQHRVVNRPADAPFTEYDTREAQEMPHAAGGVYSTAMDTAIFAQMFLNRGTYGGTRILSPASVAEMTRNQIPGISARYGDQFFPEASWGFGWNVCGSKKCVAYAETLQSPEAFSHGGAGGVFLWVDPVYEIVGVYFSVASRGGIPIGVTVPQQFGDHEMMTRIDLLVNAVAAAIVD